MKAEFFVCILFTTFQIALAIQPASGQTKFRDVTSTHVPDDPDLHSLDASLVDVDADGDLDVAIAVEGGANRLYLNDGRGVLSWQKGTFGEEVHDTEHVSGADFNLDGFTDFIFIAEDDQIHQLFMGTAGGGFRDESDRLPAMSEGNGLAVGDVNGDGLPDILVGNTGVDAPDNRNFLWLNDENRPGYFIDASDTGLPPHRDDTQDIGLADLDGDGDPDLVIANENPPNRLYLNDGSGRFTDHSDRMELTVPMETRQVHIRDYTGDGRPDILFFNLTSNNAGWEKNPRIRLLVQDRSGTFRDETAQRLPFNTFSVYGGTPIDMNRDGAVDLLFGPIQIPGFVPLRFRTYINDGNGYFRDKTEEYIPEESSGRGWGMAVGDLNGDQKNDIFIGGWGTQARLLLAGEK